MNFIEVANPTGAIEVTKPHAPRLDTLEGKIICELSNDSWQAHRTFSLIRKLIQERFPTSTIIPYTEFPTGTSGASAIDGDKVAGLLKEKGCQGVIVGNAG